MSSPKRNVAYEFDIALIDSADTGSFKVNPTIAAGDFKVSTDNGAFANLATLPVVSPAGSTLVKINLSAAEMNGDKINVQCIDAAGAEWDDVLIFIDATVVNVDDVVRSTTPANTLSVTAANVVGIDLGQDTSGPAAGETIIDAFHGAERITAARAAALTDWIDGGRLDLLLDAIPTGDSFARIGVAGAGLTDLGGMSTGMKAEVNIEVDDALNTAIPGAPTANSINERIVAIDDIVPYMPAAIYIDTVGGAAGTTKGTHGTRGNAVNSVADAVTLAASVGVNEYRLLGISSIVLTTPHVNWAFYGQNGAIVNVGTGQNTSGSHFECLTLTGDMDGNDTTQRFCKLQSLTNFIADATFCLLIDNVTESPGDHYWLMCGSGVAGPGTPYIDVDGNGVNARLNHLRGWLGGVEMRTHTSADLTSFDCPAGQIVVAASGTGGTIAMRGNMDITDNASGAVTFSENAAVNMGKINTEADTALADYDGPTKAEMDTAHDLLALASVATEARLAELDAANLPTGVDTLLVDTTQIKADLPSLPTKNIALAGFPFLMVLTSDHVTGATGLSVTAERSIDGGAYAAATNSPVEVSSGSYKIDLSAADMNGTTIMLKLTAATADARFIMIVTQPT
jgi:hypothetical protein